jgi:hypothetical protein
MVSSTSQLVHSNIIYQVLPLHIPSLSCPPLNPATLFPDGTPLEHSCLETLEILTYCQPHLSCSSLPDPDVSWFIDGSSSLDSLGKRHAGYAVVSFMEVIKSSSLPGTPPLECPCLSGQSQTTPNLLNPSALGLYTWRRLAGRFYPHTLLNSTFCPRRDRRGLRDVNLLSSLPLIYRRPALSVVTFGNYFLPTSYHPCLFRCLQDHLVSSADRLFTRCYYNLLWPINNWPCLLMKPKRNRLPLLLGTSQISKFWPNPPPPFLGCPYSAGSR